MSSQEWLKTPTNIRGCKTVGKGGIPRGCVSYIDQAGLAGTTVAATKDHIYVVDDKEETLCEWDIKEETFKRRVRVESDGIALGNLLLQGDYIFTGTHFLEKHNLNVVSNISDIIPSTYADSLSDFVEPSGYQNRFYRCVSNKDGSRGILEIKGDDFATRNLGVFATGVEVSDKGGIIGYCSNKVSLIDSDSAVVWTYRINPPERFERPLRVRLSLYPERIIGITNWGKIFLLREDDGQEIWSATVNELLGENLSEHQVSLSHPATNGIACVIKNAAAYPCTFCIENETGALLWTDTEESPKINHCIAGDLLFTSKKGKGATPYAMDLYSGEVVWKSKELFEPAFQSIASGNYVFYLGTYFQGFVYEWDEPYISPHRPQ